MQSISFANALRLAAIALFVTVLAACGGRNDIKNSTTEAGEVPASYDLSVKADKDGQFDFDGATLTGEDLRGHLRYLAEIGKPVHALLLTPGEKEKIKNTHIAALASISRDLKIIAYVTDNDGKTKVIKIVE